MNQDSEAVIKKSIAAIVWCMDPDGVMRFLMRHNRPFDGYEDEWTILFGNVESGEDSRNAAIREVEEEYGIRSFIKCDFLNYNVEYQKDTTQIIIEFYAMQVENIDTQIILDGESIGYDWMIYEKAVEIMKYEDEARALSLVK